MKKTLLALTFTLLLAGLGQAQVWAQEEEEASSPAAEEATSPEQDVPPDAALADGDAESAESAESTESETERENLAQDIQDDAPAPEVQPEEDIGTIELQAPPETVLTSPDAGDDGVQHIDEVTVTAQKTKQSARRVPVSITAFDGEAIKQTGASSLADVSLYIPNVRVDAHDPGSPQVFIRGFGTNAFNPSFESSVGFVQDEIYFGRPGYFTESMFDIERVEVLRGPQGTLFGKNTIAGVFNVISKGPEGDPSADGSVYYGNHNEQRVEAGAGGMFNDWFGARIAGYYQTKDGQLYNQQLDRNEDEMTQRAARIKLRLTPIYGLSSELTAATSETKAPFWPYQLYRLDSDTRSYLRGFDSRIEDDPYDFVTSFDTQGFIEKGSNTASLKTEWNLGDVAGIQELTPVLVLGWSKFYIDQLNDLDVSPSDITRLDSHEDHRQVSAELRFTGHSDSLLGLGPGFEFVGGGYYFESEYQLFARVLGGADLPSYALTRDACQLIAAGQGLPPEACGPLGIVGLPGVPALGLIGGPVIDNDFYQFDYGQKIVSKAVFGQATWNITEKFAVTPGLRFSTETKLVDSRGSGHCLARDVTSQLPGVPPPVCVTETLISANTYDQSGLTRNEVDLSPKLALQYFSDSDINYYASYTRGFKSGGFNAISLTGDGLEYEPEKAQTYEFGGKAKMLDRTLAINLTLYQTQFDNLQVLAFNGLFFDVSNAATARSRGMEADFLWLTPYAPLRLSGSVGLLDARYLDYPGAPAPIGQGIGSRQNLAGRRIAFAPKSSGTFTPMLTYPIGDMLGSFAVDVIFQGDQFTDTDLDPNTHVGGYTKYAARFILNSASQLWSLSIGGTNLTDKRVLNQVLDATFFPGSYFAQQASGRQLFATINFKL